MLDWRSQNDVFFVNEKFNVIQSLASLPISRRASSWLINANNGSLLVRNEDNLIIVRKFSLILQNSSDMLSFFHLIHTFMIIDRNMSNVLNWWIIIVILPNSEIHIIFKFLIWITVILVLLGNLRKNVQFLFVMAIIGVDKHVLIIWGNMIKLVHSDVLVLTFV